jgi:hypothetical protein
MTKAESEVPEGAAVFPLIPAELGVQPLLLSTLHALIFLAGSSGEIVNAAAAAEAVDYIAGYLGRVNPGEARRLKEDMKCLVSYARQQKWPKEMIVSIKSLLDDLGIDLDES